MRDRIQAAAAEKNRTMNAEIVERLEDWEALNDTYLRLEPALTYANAERERLSADLEAMALELHETRAARDKALKQAELNSEMFDTMATMARHLTGSARVEQKAVEAVASFLEGDALSLEVDLAEDGPGFTTPGPGPEALETFVAKRIVEASDRRASAMARLVAKAAGSSPDLRRRIRALTLIHSGTESSAGREVAQIFLDQGMPTDAAEFREYLLDYLAADAPETRQAIFRSATERVLPKLFPNWRSDDYERS